MIRLENLIVLLPCHGLEDFPCHHVGKDAESLLANWVALWHPNLISSAQKIPEWQSIDFITRDLSHSLLLAPTLCAADLPPEVTEVVEREQAVLISGHISVSDIFADPALRTWIDGDADAELVEEFLALGYSFLQVQLMTRQLRYSSAIDMGEFSRRVVSAAGTCKRDEGGSFPPLAACFDLLLEERNNYYPVTPRLLDLQLVARNTMPDCAGGATPKTPINFLMTGQAVESLQRKAPQSIHNLRQWLRDKCADIAGGPYVELPLQLCSVESFVHQIECGIQTMRQLLDYRPIAYASFDFGLSPQVPAILDQFEFEFCLHADFTGGTLPRGTPPTMNWQGRDGTTLAALTTPPIDAMNADGFLGLGVKIGETLDGHHHCPLVFAHWPRQESRWFRTLKRTQKYGALLGRFESVSSFAESMYDSGFSDSHAAHEYQCSWLELARQDHLDRPISRWALYWRAIIRLRSWKALVTMLAVIRPDNRNLRNVVDRISRLQTALEVATSSGDESITAIGDQIVRLLDHDEVGIQLLASPIREFDSQHGLVNAGGERKFAVTQRQPSTTSWDVVPVEGFEFSDIGTKAGIVAARHPSVVSEDPDTGLPVLRNELLEVRINSLTGGIQSVRRRHRRGNLFSQQLAIRMTESFLQHGFPRNRHRYSQMRMEEMRTENRGKAAASIMTRGILVDSVDMAGETKSETVLGRYQQTVSVVRGQNRIEFETHWHLDHSITGQAWRNYACSRIAWQSEDAVLFRSENEIRERVEQPRFTAPLFVEVQLPDAKLSLLPAGLPFHRRSNRRMLDTLMIVQGETECCFEFAVAVDAPVPVRAAIDYLSPLFAVDPAIHGIRDSGWLFHLNCQNVVVTEMTPLFDDSTGWQGVRLRLQETEGRSGELAISCPFPVTFAQRTNLLGRPLADLEVEQDRAFCRFSSCQLFQVEIRR